MTGDFATPDAPLVEPGSKRTAVGDEGANRRLLVVDDNESIRAEIRSILGLPAEGGRRPTSALALAPADGKPRTPHQGLAYQIDSAHQGAEALEMIRRARDAARPYAVAFVDLAKSQGSNCIQAVRDLRDLDDQLQIVICKADCQCSWKSILDALGVNDWLLVLKKPFDAVEVQQLACALTEKWNLGNRAAMRTEELEKEIRAHAGRLEASNAKLHQQLELLAETNTQLAKEMEARQLAAEQIRHIAFHDALTDLPNRMLLMERIEGCIERSKRREGHYFAVLYCDVDNFKVVNDSLGHRVGDQLLVQVARKLNHALRTASNELRPAYDTVARMSGDEFVILLDEVPDEEHVRAIAERIRESVSQPIAVDQNKLVLSISIGAAISAGGYDDPVDVLRDADTALYHAKDGGKGCVAMFDQEMRARVTARMDLEHDLRQAIEERQFVVYYQPIVSLVNERVVSVEALVRWIHPSHGLLMPDAFIPVAEETGVIEAMGELVLEMALKQLCRWRANVPGMENLCVNVNLSPRQLAGRSIIACVDRCLKQFQLDPSALRLEITESAMIDDLPKTRRMLQEIVDRGVEIHLDNFGTGYSSLSILHKLPFTTVKLDRSFIGNLRDELESPTTVRAIIMLAQNQGIDVVAEGIESYDQLAHLRALDCEFGQGYFFSRPLPPVEAEAYLAKSVLDSVLAAPRTTAQTAPVRIV